MAKDIIHDAVKNALINDGWRITHDPYPIKYGNLRLSADMAADRSLAAEKGNQKIVVEVKSFASRSAIQDFKLALGQYNLYLGVLEAIFSERTLYLGIDNHTYQKLFVQKEIEYICKRFQVRLLVVDIDKEEVAIWIH